MYTSLKVVELVTIRLLLTLLVIGLGGAECQANSAPAWVQQSDSAVSQALVTETTVAELLESFDSDHDVLTSDRPKLQATKSTPLLQPNDCGISRSPVAARARAPPLLA